MSTPLYDSLKNFADSAPLRLHMPGHKGRMDGLFQDVARMDFTELPPVGDLYADTGAVAVAETLFAEAAGARDALFFSCGSTQGIYTMLSAAVGMGGTLILDRGCHKSVYHGMALLDIAPVYLHPDILDCGLSEPVSPKLLEQALQAHPEAKAVLVTSPSYYGILTDLAPLAEVCHSHGTYLLVDQAHGAHFPFVGIPSAAQAGADLCVVSAHKTLPALGSSSLLYVGNQAPWEKFRLKELSAIFSTTSPSWPILASIDRAREQLERSDGYLKTAEQVRLLRERINEETAFLALTDSPALALDPCRLAVDTGSAGLSGFEADRLLRARNIYLEMADDRYLVAIFTCNDQRDDYVRFLSALKDLPVGAPCSMPNQALPVPIIRQSLREALFGPVEQLALLAAAGRTAAQVVAPYPPGIPVLAPGEEITEKHIAYLQKKSYNIEEKISVAL